MHVAYDPEQIYRDWQASGLSFEDFMVGLKQDGGDPWLAGMPPIDHSQAFFDQQTADFKIYGGGPIPSREDYMRKRGMPVKEKPKIPDVRSRMREIERELDIIRGRVPTPKGYKVDTGRIKALMTELLQLERNTHDPQRPGATGHR